MISRELVKEKTAAFREPEKQLSSKALMASNIIKLVEILIEERLPIDNKNHGFAPLVAVVPLTTRVDHEYPIGEVAIIVDSVDKHDYDRAFMKSWKIGGHLPDFDENDTDIRYATDEEIDDFFDKNTNNDNLNNHVLSKDCPCIPIVETYEENDLVIHN